MRKSYFVFSIDFKGCEDVDDIFLVRILNNGNLEFGVYIVDVIYFVVLNFYIDIEVRIRVIIYYLVDCCYDMLFFVFSVDLCFFLGGVDRYVVSIMWELDKVFYEIKKVWYGRIIIWLVYKLFYEVV